MNLPEDYLIEINEFKALIESNKQHKKEIARNSRRIKAFKKQHQFLQRLFFPPTDYDLEDAVKELLIDVGFKATYRFGKEFDREDVQCWPTPGIMIIIECKNKKHNSITDAEFYQIVKRLDSYNAKPKFKNIEKHGLIICNLNREQPIEKRKEIALDQAQWGILKSHKEFGIISTLGLYSLYKKIKNSSITIEEFSDTLIRKGIITV